MNGSTYKSPFSENICSYCGTKMIFEQMSAKLKFKKKRIPPPGAKDLGLYDEKEEEWTYSYHECPECGCHGRQQMGYPYEIAKRPNFDKDKAFKQWLYQRRSTYYYDDYEILSMEFHDRHGTKVYNESERAAFRK